MDLRRTTSARHALRSRGLRSIGHIDVKRVLRVMRVLGVVGALASLAATEIACSSDPRSQAPVTRVTGAIVSNPAVVISQVYGGGGNASAPFTNDFVELFNRTSSPVSLAGWSVQYASATGTGLFSANPVTALAGTLAPGHYYLVQMAGGATGAPLPTPDATGTTAMSATAAKVALVAGAAGLACNGGSTPCSATDSAQILDLVGYGNANFFEGSAAVATLGNITAALRSAGGCTDTNNNGGDFSVTAPAPRNAASAANLCAAGEQAPAVAATVPTAGATNVAAGAPVSITFSEPVAVSGSWFTFACSASGPVAPALSGGPTTFVLTPPTALAPGEICQVTVLAAGVSDVDTMDPPDNPTSDFGFSFTIAPPVAMVAIHDVQGAAHISPLVGQTVSVGPAVVTARAGNGFYMQDPAPDANDATSEGIFVFTSSAPAVAVGDEVVVRGLVGEFRSGCSACTPSDSAYANLTSTEIDAPSVTVSAHGRALPPPVVLGTGAGERRQPRTIIEDDATGNVETSGIFDPASDGIDFLESLEGMRVRIDNPVVVDPSRTFSAADVEIGVLARAGADAGPRTPRGGIILAPGDFNPERLFLANALTPASPLSFPILNVGDAFAGSVVGVVGYTFANYKILVSEALPPVVSGGLTSEVTPLVRAAPTELVVASMNVENLDPTDPPAKFARLAGIVVANLGAPDLLAVEEVQDNDGAADDGVVDATSTLNLLIAAITAAGGPTYGFRAIDPVNDQDGGEPGGNIRVVFLFRTDRGLSFVDRPGATSTTSNDVTVTAGAPHLAFSPGRIDPSNAAFASSRKPLAAEVLFQGRTLFVIANHFNSKGGDQPLFGRFQPPALVSETQRVAQANVVAGFVGRLLAVDPNASIFVLGDLNDFSFSAALSVLKNAGLTDLIETLPANERYTYVFEGNSQALDHILASVSVAPRTAFDVVHVNAEFSDQASDHDPGVARWELGGAPVFTTAPLATVQAGATYVYDANATGSPTPGFALVAGPTGMTIDASTGLVTWAASAAPGNVQVTVRAQNGVSPDAIQSFQLTVAAPEASSVPALPVAASIGLVASLAICGAWLTRRRVR